MKFIVIKETLESSYSHYHFELPLPFKHSLLSDIGIYQENVANLECQAERMLNFGRELNVCELWFARLFKALGCYDRYHEMVRKVFEWRERNLGAEHIETILVFEDLFNSLLKTGKLVDMEITARLWINTSERLYGNEDLHTFRAYVSLASSLVRLQRYEEAESIYNTKLKSYESIFGSGIWPVLLAKHNQALNLQRVGKLKEATELFRESLDIQHRTYGEKDPRWFFTACCLADVLAEQDLWEESESLMSVVFEGRKKLLGITHVDTLNTAAQLAIILIHRNQMNEAEELSRYVMQQRQHVLGPEHPHTVVSEREYAFTLENNHKYREAEAVYRDVINRNVKMWGVEHEDTLHTLKSLIYMLWSQRKYNDCEDTYRSILGDWETDLQETTTLERASVLSELASVYLSQEKYGETELILGRILDIQKHSLGTQDTPILSTLRNLGYCYRFQSKYHEAEEVDRISLLKKEKIYGLDGKETVWSVINLALDLEYQE